MIYTILDYLDSAEKRCPDKIVYTDQNESVSFHILKLHTERIGSVISGLGRTKAPVAVFMEKSVRIFHPVPVFMTGIKSRSYWFMKGESFRWEK